MPNVPADEKETGVVVTRGGTSGKTDWRNAEMRGLPLRHLAKQVPEICVNEGLLTSPISTEKSARIVCRSECRRKLRAARKPM